MTKKERLKPYGHIVRSLRQEKGLSRKALSDCTNISIHILRGLENNVNSNKIDCLFTLADFFGVSLSFLTGGD
ncbi:MAG: helix-turn-helix domain-containing protein [Firmicutes bacterium]|nr:helix-turn-helix domain-containing protein [Bacillota bacterium]